VSPFTLYNITLKGLKVARAAPSVSKKEQKDSAEQDQNLKEKNTVLTNVWIVLFFFFFFFFFFFRIVSE
jgi:hypothetical protein